jgi:uroporphyrin-3 C-methyltransferase
VKEESKEPSTETGTEQDPVAPAAARQNGDAPVVAPRKSSRGTGVGWLALLLAIAAMGLSGWMYYQSTLVVAERSDAGAALDAALSSQRQDAATLRRENDATLDRLREEITAIQLRSDEQLAGLSAALQTQRQQLLEVNSTDRSDWMLAEAEYLLRLANQRLIMASDVRSAMALLSSADAILLELNDVSLHSARGAIARDLAALRAVPVADVEGTWLRIQALVGEIDRLTLFELREQESRVAELPADSNWQQRLKTGFAAALEKLAGYVTIRRRDAPYSALLDPQWEGLVRQNLRLVLEQARSALLSGNQSLYSQSLGNAKRWVAEFFSFNEAAVLSLQQELGRLEAIPVGQQYPDISGSLSALKTAANSRHATEGGSL